MGLYSFNCRGCGESIKAPYSLENYLVWQNKAVCLEEIGNITIGSYDGYGQIDGRNDLEFCDWWHHQCWIEAGKPPFEAPAKSAKDQGYFFHDKTRDLTSQLTSIATSEKKCSFCGIQPVATELRCVDVCVTCLQTALHMGIGVLELDVERIRGSV